MVKFAARYIRVRICYRCFVARYIAGGLPEKTPFRGKTCPDLSADCMDFCRGEKSVNSFFFEMLLNVLPEQGAHPGKGIRSTPLHY
ncbi:MAG: hypothetical protein LBJ23_03245 [Tannerella sp.]|jgi:hypothetical protein|nr:hypothetical protein [Tannerella sp.]